MKIKLVKYSKAGKNEGALTWTHWYVYVKEGVVFVLFVRLKTGIWYQQGRCKQTAQMITSIQFLEHDDVIKWKYFPGFWPFVRGIHWSPGNSPHKGQSRGALIFFLDLRLSKHSRGWWFETPSHSLWRHCNGKMAPLLPKILSDASKRW